MTRAMDGVQQPSRLHHRKERNNRAVKQLQVRRACTLTGKAEPVPWLRARSRCVRL